MFRPRTDKEKRFQVCTAREVAPVHSSLPLPLFGGLVTPPSHSLEGKNSRLKMETARVGANPVHANHDVRLRSQAILGYAARDHFMRLLASVVQVAGDSFVTGIAWPALSLDGHASFPPGGVRAAIQL